MAAIPNPKLRHQWIVVGELLANDLYFRGLDGGAGEEVVDSKRGEIAGVGLTNSGT